MTFPHIDTDVIIRLLTGDDPDKQTTSVALFRQIEAGTLEVAAPDTVIADAVYVLSSPRLYHLPRHQIAAMLTTLVRLSGFRVANRHIVLDALGIYGSVNLDFGDAMIAASMQHSQATRLFSYDQDFDRIPGIERVEPHL